MKLLPLPKIMRFRGIVAAFVIFSSLWSCQDINKPPPNSLEIRGQALRKDIDAAYRKLVKADIRIQGANISETFVLHIPVGTSFDDAETILKAAGFFVSRRPNESDLFNNDGYTIHANINPYVQHLVSRDILFVQLISAKKYEFKTVQRVRAVLSELSL